MAAGGTANRARAGFAGRPVTVSRHASLPMLMTPTALPSGVNLPRSWGITTVDLSKAPTALPSGVNPSWHGELKLSSAWDEARSSPVARSNSRIRRGSLSGRRTRSTAQVSRRPEGSGRWPRPTKSRPARRPAFEPRPRP
jgi:hypothetical protein